jgi:hypothetical protein
MKTKSGLFVLALSYLLVAGGSNAQAATAVSVADFGAMADDSRDDTAAVHKALAFCRENSVKKMVFPKGKYDFMEGKGETYAPTRWAFPLSNCRDLTIDGQGSLLMFHGLQFPVYGKNNRKVTIKNFTIDYERAPYSVGKVKGTASDGSSFDIVVDPQYPVRGGEKVGAFLEVEPESGLPVTHGLSVYYRVASTELIAPQVLRVKLTVKIPRVKPGMTIVLRHYLYKGALIRVSHSRDMVFENLTAYSGTGMGIVGQYLHNLTVKKVKLMKNPERNAPMSNASDGLNLLTCSGTVLVEDCVFSGMGDDGMNIFANYWTVKKRINATSVEIYNEKHRSHETPEESAGDVFEFLRSDSLQVYGSRVIKTIKPNFKTYSAVVEFTTALPESLRVGDDVLMKKNRLKKVLIRNCVFSPVRGRGITIQVPNVTVQDCEFRNSSSSGIHVSTVLSPWFEAGPTRNLLFKNNLFLNCSRFGGGKNSAVIQIGAILRNREVDEDLSTVGKCALTGVHRDIRIINNKIIRSNNGGIVVNAVDGILIKNNLLQDTSMAPDQTWQTRYRWSEHAVTLLGVKNLNLSGNTCTFTDQPEKLGTLAVGEGCDKSTLKLTKNKGFAVEFKNVLP